MMGPAQSHGTIFLSIKCTIFYASMWWNTRTSFGKKVENLQHTSTKKKPTFTDYAFKLLCPWKDERPCKDLMWKQRIKKQKII